MLIYVLLHVLSSAYYMIYNWKIFWFIQHIIPFYCFVTGYFVYGDFGFYSPHHYLL